MSFGLRNAPSTFLAIMNDILRPYLRKFILVFFDDILIYSIMLEEHVGYLTTVLEVLKENQFVANFKKCHFRTTSIEYLGHIVSAEGVLADSTKIEAMQQWSIPRNIKELHGFFGLTNYYHKFVANYGSIALPLTQLLKKGNFVWTTKAEDAFHWLKKAMTTFRCWAHRNLKSHL